jgi:DNA-binding MarR family transcriptional regulator
LEKTSGKEEMLQPEDMLCFELHAASRAMTAVYRPLLGELGLTYPQYLVMVLLWEGSPRLVNELGRELELDSGTLSPLLKRLEGSGLVLRRRREEDERELEVTLTESGQALRERARHIPAAVEQAADLAPGEMEELVGRLASLRSSLYRSASG